MVDDETAARASRESAGQKVTPSSTFQIVKNPSWLTPYFACLMVGFGLAIQFLIHLVGFVQKRNAPAPVAALPADLASRVAGFAAAPAAAVDQIALTSAHPDSTPAAMPKASIRMRLVRSAR